ncbi:hypothetical protein K469DRAFT_686732 [Zopfia rhizophila CBS 207.26]|uniref:Heterokaryon incompatibility domain-containing protein n=1 Tax=Zopfia rhizophila CBS 207.26 TaxID=1314779 RepID=A0A6A6EVG5_9PEZI|nr:hypothetical protein K469DRAFT_686732 [Zopfia rhizophila CBS 207.26]
MDKANHFPFPDERRKWQAFQNLLRHTFWTRMWIIQELIVARSVVLLYGGQIIPWDIFAKIVKCFKTTDENSVSVLVLRDTFGGDRRSCRYGMDFVARLHHLREQYFENTLPALPYLLVECIQSQAGKTHDKLYALWGLSPSYSIAINDLYRNTTEYSLRMGCFALVSLAGVANRESKPGLPSWVPDLSNLPRLYPLDNAHRKYTVGGSSQMVVHLESDSIINIKGRLLDQIYLVDRNNPWTRNAALPGPELEALIQGSVDEHRCAEWMQWPWDFLRTVEDHYESIGRERYFCDKPLLEAFIRTSIGNDDNISFPASDKTIEVFELVLELIGFTESISEGHYSTLDDDRPNLTIDERLMIQRVPELMSRRSLGRQFALTKEGYIALVPDGAIEGDWVCVFQGSKVPYMLRSDGNEKNLPFFRLVGEVYVHSLMDGEYLERNKEDKLGWITLI